jgi:hypothetical protein
METFMRKFLPKLAFLALTFLLVLTACGLQQPTTTPAEATALASNLTMLPGGTAIVVITNPEQNLTPGPGTQLAPPVAAGTGTPQGVVTVLPLTPGNGVQIPATGAGETQVLCQFCVDGLAHAMIILPVGATFQVLPPNGSNVAAAQSCTAVEQINGKALLICTGGSPSTFELKVCTGDKCSQFPIKLNACPKQQQQPQSSGGSAPILPTATLPAGITPAPIIPTATLPAVFPTDTPVPVLPTSTTEPATPTPVVIVEPSATPAASGSLINTLLTLFQ